MKFAVIIFVFSLLILAFPLETQAAAWWGEGSRKDEWVLERGGAMIFYQVEGESNNPEYKARMYLKDELIETEKNARGVFDDAINNTYKIVIFKGEEAVISTEVVVRPGEEIKFLFDLKENEVKKESVLLPANKIRLNSKSAQYIKPSDIMGDSSLTKGEEVVDSAQAYDQARKEQEEKIASLKSDLEAFERLYGQELSDAGERKGVAYLFRGPGREVLTEAHIEIAKVRDALLELRRLQEGSASAGILSETESQIVRIEEALSQKEALLKEIEKETNFWYRLKKFF